MGTTEESIVYQLLNAVRASELSNDETITERRVRSFLRTHRTQEVYKMSRAGLLVTDEFFQDVALTLKQINTEEWVGEVPDIVQLPNNHGIKLQTRGFTNVSVIGEERYQLSKKNIVNMHMASAKVEGRELMVRIPQTSPYSMNGAATSESLYACMKRNSEYFRLSVVLDNPDDAIDYDWTKSNYPVPNQLIQTLKESILRKEFATILQTKSDQVPNMKNDTLRYHDQGKVQQ
jgi:hypothetical protein